MKKHIIISGVPRAGKSTISQMISKTFGYQHVSMDSIIAGIENIFPETGIDSDADVPALDNITNISSKMSRFIREMIDSCEYDECDYGMVIDIYQLLPQDYVRCIDSSVCDIYYFITADVTPEERFQILKENDTPKDYTYYISDEENYDSCFEIVDISKIMKEQCILYGLPFFETSRDRENIMNSFIQSFLL